MTGRALAKPGGGLVLRDIKCVNVVFIGPCPFNRVQVRTVDVFNQGNFEHFLVGGGADNRGQSCKACQFSGPQSAFAGNQFQNRIPAFLTTIG